MDPTLVIARQSSYYSCVLYLLAVGISFLIHFGGPLIRWLFLSVLTALHSFLHPLSADNRRLVAEVEAAERALPTLHPMRDFVARARLERRLVALHAERESRLAPHVAARARLELLAVGSAVVARVLLAPSFLIALSCCSRPASLSRDSARDRSESVAPASQLDVGAAGGADAGSDEPAPLASLSLLALSPQSLFLLCNLLLFIARFLIPSGKPITAKSLTNSLTKPKSS